jgi:hypothetical protein
MLNCNLPQNILQDFKLKFRKLYIDKNTESQRFQSFLINLKHADERNVLDSTATHGLTRFSDLTALEFQGLYLNNRPLSQKFPRVTSGDYASENPNRRLSSVNPNLYVDWTGNYTTKVKDQMQCGSCWAFGSTEQVESDAMRTMHSNYVLSPQQIVNCDTGGIYFLVFGILIIFTHYFIARFFNEN